MARKKKVEVTKEEVVDWVRVYPDGTMKVAYVLKVMEGERMLSQNKQARVINPGDSQTGEPAMIKTLMKAMHTPAKVRAFQKTQPG